MYLKSLKVNNFRKFGLENNKIEFVDAKSFREQKEGKEINIAPTTTLIVGKNNSGKTTIINALDTLINKNGDFKSNDFNFSYLKKLLDQYEKYTEIVETPYLEFIIGIGIEDNSNDLITNLIPFMVLEDVDKSELEILVKFELEDEETFIRDIKQLLKKHTGSIRFKGFLELIDHSKFNINYYNASGGVINRFNIKSFIELRAIKANNIENENSLSKAFGTIIKYRFKSLFEEGEQELDLNIDSINTNLTEIIYKKHTKDINESLGVIQSADKLKVLLSADLTSQKLINNLIKYEYIEQDNSIPENQFGLGYTNLMMIIADLIDYMEKYPENSFNSRVNLISIEEPETFMHPQMQELFIKNINDAIASLLKSKNKNVNSQLIITTHSSHILNSKIHTGNTFNNINYVTINDHRTHVVNLYDDIIIPKSTINNGIKRAADLKFLKKHIKYKVSELFFSDAIILVEGITEETLLKYYIDQTDSLNKYYISVFNIDGAHGLVYHELINLLKVPALIITDLDIKRDEKEKKTFEQITDLKDRVTTNKTIKKHRDNSDNLEGLPEKIEINNMYIAYQRKIEGYYATSFEEAFILTNYKNVLLNSVLINIKRNIYKDIIRRDKRFKSIKENSYKLQRKLSDNKSDFANELLYKFITQDEDVTIPSLPMYIKDGLSWLTKKLEEEKQ
ncbi:ATP-dependent nuclease [Aneurinibacillus aneurinilyticus]|uniref:ATP-dependent nuclease n=2 Tax=Aneurinibacillus aneurinilyticus TaxID=1391 RepID=UPI0023F7D64D|nr:AAA family ATPase [Aneurinibacillus aneurinilyticus]MCI1693699.1 AAA family ATPase [Aneurinibacillus aneurinilyticus]